MDAESPSYVARKADDELYDGLSRGEYCYVLTSRQMDKSSLAIRIAVRLRSDPEPRAGGTLAYELEHPPNEAVARGDP